MSARMGARKTSGILSSADGSLISKCSAPCTDTRGRAAATTGILAVYYPGDGRGCEFLRQIAET
eukprot:1395484-Amorphochlora_amoeboformis.AAC.1